MHDLADGQHADLTRLKRQLNRERKARLEAETIAEKALRELYEKNRALEEEVKNRKRLEMQYLQAQKMEAVGRLAGGIAHDFNNLLTAIIGYSEILHKTLCLGPPAHGFVAEIAKAGHRAADLVQQLLAFSRRQMLEPVVLNINELVTDLEKMVRRLIGEDIDTVTILDPALTPVKADRSRLEQVFVNLVVNARDAMPEGGKLTIETGNIDLNKKSAQTHPEIPPGRYAMLAITDTGYGMDEATRLRIFEPFFTTKEAGKGTGLGLATVYGIVQQSGGGIYVYSEPGVGTTFKVYLPQAKETQPADRDQPSQSDLSRGGTETVLFVEDEEQIRSLGRLTLQEKGYTVLEAANGHSATRLCQEYRGPIHLVVTDVVMPGITGRQLSERLTSLRANLRVLFVSGYTENVIIHHGVLDPATNFLAKPYTPDGLARKVREVLDR